MDLVAFGCGRLRPRAGDRRRGTAQLLRAAKMQRGAPPRAEPLAARAALRRGGQKKQRSPAASRVSLAGWLQGGRSQAPAWSCLRR